MFGIRASRVTDPAGGDADATPAPKTHDISTEVTTPTRQKRLLIT
jgi:hypothetical protein